MNKNLILDRIDGDRQHIVNLCKRMVEIPSENPPGDTRAIAEFVSSLLTEKGIEHSLYAPDARMPNIVARIRGKLPGKRLILNGHLDTFPAGSGVGWKKNPFGGEVVDGKIYGRGVSDMKGGDAAFLMAFFYTAERADLVKGELVLTLVSDEETGGKWGTGWLLDNVPETRGDAVLNGEPGSCELVHFAEKGQLWLEVKAVGKAGHSAYTHQGKNAIHRMLHFLDALEELEKMRSTHPTISEIQEKGRGLIDSIKGEGATDVLGRVTVNTGTISGGVKLNLIPDFCTAEVDIRLPHGLSSSTVIERVRKIADRFDGLSYQILHVTEPTHTSIEEKIVQITLKNAQGVRGPGVALSSGISGNDCRYFRNRGIPCCFYGPRFFNLGAPDEYILVDDLVDCVKVHTLTCFEYLGLF